MNDIEKLESLGIPPDDIYVCDNCGYENELENGWDLNMIDEWVVECPKCGIEKGILL